MQCSIDLKSSRSWREVKENSKEGSSDVQSSKRQDRKDTKKSSPL